MAFFLPNGPRQETRWGTRDIARSQINAGPSVSRPVPSVLVFGLCNDRLGYPNGFITSAVACRLDSPSQFREEVLRSSLGPLLGKLNRWIS